MNSKTVLTIAAVGVVGYILIKNEAKNLASTVDPTSSDNVFYTGVNKVGSILTQNDGFDLGSWIFDITHPMNRP